MPKPGEDFLRHTPQPKGDVDACEECGAPAVLRTNRDTGATFTGCSRYPACDWILGRDLEQDARNFDEALVDWYGSGFRD